VRLADGTTDAEERLKRVLRNDPGMGVIRHSDAGYELAQQTLKANDLDFKDKLK
jgi:urocanate hydratase